jgi:hypothetical protein
MQMTPLQSRMARAALGWSIDDLGKAASVRAATVSSFERGGDAYASTVRKLQDALEAGGVVFFPAGDGVPSGGAGVRLR